MPVAKAPPDNVVPIKSPVPDVIGVLEEALQRARNGELTIVAIAAVTKDDGVMHAWSYCSANIGALIGAVAVLQHDLITTSE